MIKKKLNMHQIQCYKQLNLTSHSEHNLTAPIKKTVKVKSTP